MSIQPFDPFNTPRDKDMRVNYHRFIIWPRRMISTGKITTLSFCVVEEQYHEGEDRGPNSIGPYWGIVRVLRKSRVR
jgi:hypothetical protein